MSIDPHGHLHTWPAQDRLDLVAPPVAAALGFLPSARVLEIDPAFADTAAMCAHYGVPLDTSGNCVLVTGRRGDVEKHVACVALATTRVDVNSFVRKRLDVRKASFSAMDFAVSATGMEYGGITPVGVPQGWPVWIDAAVAATPEVLIGSGIRGSKILVRGDELAGLPLAEVLDGLARAIPPQ